LGCYWLVVVPEWFMSCCLFVCLFVCSISLLLPWVDCEQDCTVEKDTIEVTHDDDD
jgi:hypothetical protein